MIFAALGNIRGNLPALEALLRDVDPLGIQIVLNAGNSVAGHPWPNEVVELVRARVIVSVQGLLDRHAVRFQRSRRMLEKKCGPRLFDHLRVAHERTRSENLEFLHALPRQLTLRLEGIEILLCHGTPSSQTETLGEKDSLARFQREREVAPVPIIVCGGSGGGYARWVADTLFVNPGSVSPDAPASSPGGYALINTESAPWSVEFRAV